jgi:uncharacterized protein YecE (DUF72 family)
LGEILIGTASWTDPTLIKSGRFYPPRARTAEDRLRYYATQFNMVEVDSSYYGMPAQDMSGLWVKRTPDSFTFDIKAFRLFTKHPTSPTTIPKAVRDAFPDRLKTKKRFYYRDLPREITGELWRRFEDALLPLDSAGKLGVVLFQFPSWFFPANENRDHILECKRMLPQYQVAVEFRHGSWLNEKNYDRTMSFLRDNGLAYVSVDEPQGLRTSVPPLAEATADIAVVRFHGRNAANWEKPQQKLASSRFKYLYGRDELAEWVPKVKELASKTRKLHIVFNNCFEDQAVNGARDLAMMLDGLTED